MKNLDKLAFCATSVGSVPHKNIDKTLDFLFETFKDIPFWPQFSLLGRSEDMMIQAYQGFPGLIYDKDDERYYVDTESDEYYEQLEELIMDYETIVEAKDYSNLDKYGIKKESSVGFPLWIERVKKLSPIALKGQIVGPFTFSTSLTDQDKNSIYYDDTLKEITIKFLALKAIWQIEQFKKANPNADYIISLDEPSISQYGSSAFLTIKKGDIVEMLNAVEADITKNDAHSFIHCCGNTDWTIVTSSNIRILSFDTYNFSDSFLLYPQEIKSYLEKENMIAWGLTPTMDPNQVESLTVEELESLFSDILNKFEEKGIDKSLIINQSMLATACGTGMITESQAEKALTITGKLSYRLKEKYIK